MELDNNIIGLLIQVPLLGVFIWYSLHLQKRFDESLNRRDELYEKRNSALVEAITALTREISCMSDRELAHHEKTETVLEIIKPARRSPTK